MREFALHEFDAYGVVHERMMDQLLDMNDRHTMEEGTFRGARAVLAIRRLLIADQKIPVLHSPAKS